ncbi:galanin receptor 2a-like [Clytia hemisphaerica]|uniref:galanin receptor 2a-like n=1 Tax=Clytia hemisphaerica TaxID=252671 RepID=UPI0034D7B542
MKYRDVIFMVISPTQACLMVILNIVIICIMTCFTKPSKRRKLIYFLNLALSDLFLGFIVLLVKIMVSLEKTNPDNQILKEIRMFFQMKVVSLSLYISVLSIAAITTERLILVLYPFKYNRLRYWKKCVACGLMWMTSSTAVIAMHFLVGDDNKEYILTPALALSTMLLASISFAMIRRHLSQANRLLNRSISKPEKEFTNFCYQSFLLFVVCWLPISVFGIIFSSNVINHWEYVIEFRFTCHVIAFTNSVLSPILFLVHFANKLGCKRDRHEQNDTSISESTGKTLVMRFSKLKEMNRLSIGHSSKQSSPSVSVKDNKNSESN